MSMVTPKVLSVLMEREGLTGIYWWEKEPAVLRGMSHLRVDDVSTEYIKRVDCMKQVSLPR